MKCLLVIVGVLALLAMSHAEIEEIENVTVDQSEGDLDNSSPAPLPPKRRPGPPGPPNGFGLGPRNHGRQRPGQQQNPAENHDNNPNPPKENPQLIPVISNIENSHYNTFAEGHNISIEKRHRSTTTTAAP